MVRFAELQLNDLESLVNYLLKSGNLLFSDIHRKINQRPVLENRMKREEKRNEFRHKIKPNHCNIDKQD